MSLMKRSKHFRGVADLQAKCRPARLEGFVQALEAFHQEIELPPGMFNLCPEAGFENVHWQHGSSAGHSCEKWRVIMNPEVSFKPDNMQVSHGTNIEHPSRRSSFFYIRVRPERFLSRSFRNQNDFYF